MASYYNCYVALAFLIAAASSASYEALAMAVFLALAFSSAILAMASSSAFLALAAFSASIFALSLASTLSV